MVRGVLTPLASEVPAMREVNEVLEALSRKGVRIHLVVDDTDIRVSKRMARRLLKRQASSGGGRVKASVYPDSVFLYAREYWAY